MFLLKITLFFNKFLKTFLDGSCNLLDQVPDNGYDYGYGLMVMVMV